jgi:hypothetical protein
VKDGEGHNENRQQDGVRTGTVYRTPLPAVK